MDRMKRDMLALFFSFSDMFFTVSNYAHTHIPRYTQSEKEREACYCYLTIPELRWRTRERELHDIASSEKAACVCQLTEQLEQETGRFAEIYAGSLSTANLALSRHA